jgi:hypothetical protein
MGITKKMQLEEMDRISREEYDEDGNPKTLDELSGIPSRDNNAEEEEMKKFGGGNHNG